MLRTAAGPSRGDGVAPTGGLGFLAIVGQQHREVVLIPNALHSTDRADGTLGDKENALIRWKILIC